jgi:hypothetical protein
VEGGCSNRFAGSGGNDAIGQAQQTEQVGVASCGHHCCCDVLDNETGITLFAAGSPVVVKYLDVWEVGSCMLKPEAFSAARTAAAAEMQEPLLLFGVVDSRDVVAGGSCLAGNAVGGTAALSEQAVRGDVSGGGLLVPGSLSMGHPDGAAVAAVGQDGLVCVDTGQLCGSSSSLSDMQDRPALTPVEAELLIPPARRQRKVGSEQLWQPVSVTGEHVAAGEQAQVADQFLQALHIHSRHI